VCIPPAPHIEMICKWMNSDGRVKSWTGHLLRRPGGVEMGDLVEETRVVLDNADIFTSPLPMY
jgi:hypothetical protein